MNFDAGGLMIGVRQFMESLFAVGEPVPKHNPVLPGSVRFATPGKQGAGEKQRIGNTLGDSTHRVGIIPSRLRAVNAMPGRRTANPRLPSRAPASKRLNLRGSYNKFTTS